MNTTNVSTLNRRHRIVSAALRAAYAWSVRREHPVRSIDEVSRMTGVLTAALGPADGPSTPMQTIQVLGKPLGRFLPPLGVDEPAGMPGADDAVLLTADGALGADAYQLAAESSLAALLQQDPNLPWPSWAWTQSEDAERRTFAKLIASGDEDTYRVSRQTLIENPAGTTNEIAEAFNNAGAERVAEYVDLPSGKQFSSNGSAWWWPCPTCKWPMSVGGPVVRCRYRYHSATFQVVERPIAPELLVSNPSHDRDGQTPPQARPAAGTQQIGDADWRFIVVPGVSELRIAKTMSKRGAKVMLYPHLDRYDLDITVGDNPPWDVDVKEHNTAESLLRNITDKPPKARYLVLPMSHAAQKSILKSAVPDHVVLTEAELIGAVTKAIQRGKGDER